MNPLFGQGGTDRFRRAVEEKFGFKVDENLNLHRVEASSDTIPLIIPRPPADLPGNISQEEVVEWLWQRQPDVNLRGHVGWIFMFQWWGGRGPNRGSLPN